MKSFYTFVSVVLPIFLFLSLLFLNSSASEVKAWSCGQGCTFSTECSSCCDPGDPACSYSCLSNSSTYGVKRCVRSEENTSAVCNNWCGWSACSGGFRTRDCCDGVHNEFQIEACNTPTPRSGGGGTSGPTPTNPPPVGCTVNSAVLTPNNPTVQTGNSVTFSLSVSDSPSGCASDGNFVRSNTNVAITSTNPDAGLPFTATVRCDNAGTATLTGQAMVGSSVRASDSTTITCVQSCSTTTWTNGLCGGGACSASQRQQTRSVSPAGCAPTSQCITDASCGPTPTIPVGCTAGSWSNGACGGGACTSTQREQTRTVSPVGCTTTSRCVADSGCSNGGTCTPTSWVNGACGGGGCGATQRQQTRTVSPAGCDNTSQCISDASCGPTPTLPAGCTASGWANGVCGGGSCLNGQREQTRTVSPAGCSTTSRCVSDGACSTGGGGTPLPTATPRPTNTPTPTPVPVCNTPRPRDPPQVTCGAPGTIIWEWNDVARVNQYNLVIQQLVGGTWQNVNDYGWQSASTYGCNGDGAGTCSRTERRSGGPFRSRIRARNTNTLLCAASPFDNSSQVTVWGCTTISLPDLTLNGAPTSSTSIVSTTNMPPGQAINFSVADTNIATVNPSSDNTPAYQTTVTSQGIGQTTYTASTSDYYGNPVSDTAQIEVINPQPWCQAAAGDLIARRNITCNIPGPCGSIASCQPFIIASDSNEAPGVAAAGSSISDGVGQTSRNPYNFTVTNDQYAGQVYDYNYLSNKASSASFGTVSGTVNTGSDLAAGTPSGGYVWKRASGNLTIGSNIDLGGNRVVLFVNGNLQIRGKINLADGQGFFMAIVSGNITVDPTVHDSGALGSNPDTTPELEGIYFTGRNFLSDSAGNDADQQLHIRGVAVADDFDLRRDLPDNSGIPSELFEFGPDQVLRLPPSLSRRQVIWREVAP